MNLKHSLVGFIFKERSQILFLCMASQKASYIFRYQCYNVILATHSDNSSVEFLPLHCVFCADLLPCSSGTCKNGGSCYKTGAHSVCVCAPGYSGQHCETGPHTLKHTGARSSPRNHRWPRADRRAQRNKVTVVPCCRRRRVPVQPMPEWSHLSGWSRLLHLRLPAQLHWRAL